MKKIVILLVLISSALFAGEKWDRFKNDLSEFKSEVKTLWEESESRCKYCGKKIHGRDVCVECAYKRSRDFVKKKSSEVKEDWGRVKPRVQGGLKSVSENIRENYPKAKEDASGLINDVQIVYGRLTSEEAKEVYITSINNYLTVRKKCLEIKKNIKDKTAEGIRWRVNEISNIEVHGKRIGDMAYGVLSSKFPELARHGVFDDSESVVALATLDKKYFVSDFRVFEDSRGQRTSALGLATSRTGLRDGDFERGLQVLHSAHKISDGEVTPEDIDLGLRGISKCINREGK